MSIFSKLSKIFSGPAGQPSGGALGLAVRCARCGEIIHTRVDLANDLSADYNATGATRYFCHKQLIGEGAGGMRCFQRVDVDLYFDEGKRLVGVEVSGGEVVE